MGNVVLVTGGGGFIGKHLVRRLVETGVPVRVLARRELDLPGAVVFRCDLTSAIPPAALDGVSTVIHLAGVTKALRPAEYAAGNVTATRNLAAVCGPEIDFIHVSSLAAAGPSVDGRLLTEDDLPRPVSLYGQSKLAGEAALRESPAGGHAIILRPAVVYGPGDRDVFQVFRGISRGVMAGIGTLDARFSYVYVQDLIGAILAALENAPRVRGRTYFIANPEPVSWRTFAQLAAEAMHRKVRCLALPPALAYAAGLMSEMAGRLRGKPAILSRDKVREGVHPYWVCDVARAASELGFIAPTELPEGIAKTLDWYRSSGWLSW